ncbi:MAG: hypothetical protein NZ898_08915 [Myxococcota bacterium]|nr:hypothetical protein [Myxococcota bacterium]MDW8363792.1 hypothetical protein [Myxococcales bacterium]
MSAALVLTALLAGCGGAPRAAVAPVARAPESVELRGTVLFEARSVGPRGLSMQVELRPARWVRLVVRGVDGGELARSETDARGAFRVRAPVGAVLEIVATVRGDGFEATVTEDALGRAPYVLRVEPGALRAGVDATLIVRDETPRGEAGALHLLDTLVRGLQAARTWSNRALPPLFAYWARGRTTSWSFYRGERPAGSGRYALELLGGEPGARATSDTDEHDEAIVLHELGHFVMDVLSSDSSAGGDHPAGSLYDPGLAWEEGRASWFAVAVLGTPRYVDSIGMEPFGRLRVDHDFERGVPDAPRGPGSETGVAEILWDLADGADGLPDADADGIALGPAAVLRAMIAHGAEPGAVPFIGSFLDYLLRSGLVSRDALARLLRSGGHPEDLAQFRWPVDLVPPARVAGKIDGLTDPAPSGGRARPTTGFDAVRTFRVRIDRTTRLVARLRIEGSGRPEDRTDVDLELRDGRSELIDASRGNAALETVGRVLQPGTYLLVVRDGGSGNRAGWTLDVELWP